MTNGSDGFPNSGIEGDCGIDDTGLEAAALLIRSGDRGRRAPGEDINLSGDAMWLLRSRSRDDCCQVLNEIMIST
jgi:hypothetical protein